MEAQKKRGRPRKNPVVAVEPKRRGRPAGVKNLPKTQKPVDWEGLAKKLQRALATEIKRNDELEWAVGVYKNHIDELENRGWLSRLFNLKG